MVRSQVQWVEEWEAKTPFRGAIFKMLSCKAKGMARETFSSKVNLDVGLRAIKYIFRRGDYG